MTLQPLPSGWVNQGPLSSIFTPPSRCNYLTISSPAVPTVTSTITITTDQDSNSNPTATVSVLLQITTTTIIPEKILYDPLLAPSCFPTQYPTPSPQVTTFTDWKDTATTSTLYYPTSMYFYPGRCPSGWDVRPLWMHYLPANYTMAQCCPSYPNTASSPSPNLSTPTPTISKRRGKNGSGRKQPTTNTYCDFALPTDEPMPATVTAISNGNLTTLPLEKLNDIGISYVFATGITVLWKTGDFPDLDAVASASEAAAAASSAAAHGHEDIPPEEYKAPVNLPLILSLVFVAVLILFMLIVWAFWRKFFGFTGIYSLQIGPKKSGGLFGWLKRRSGGKGAPGVVRRGLDPEDRLESEHTESSAANGSLYPKWLIRWMRKKVGQHAVVASGEARRSEEGLLTTEGKGSAASASSKPDGTGSENIPNFSRPTPTSGDTIEEIPPPPYAASESYAGPSTTSTPASSSAVPIIVIATSTTTTTLDTRNWNETREETTRRILDEQRAQLLEAIKRGREERRARERNNTP